MQTKPGLMIVNLGTPDSTKTSDVGRYLKQFLSDPRVIDIPPVRRWLLLNLLILPFRPKKSAEAYRKVWTERGSPLMFHSQDLVKKLSEILGDNVQVELAMRYQNPSIKSALDRFRAKGIDRIIVLPMFPQYSTAAWGSAIEEVYAQVSKQWNTPTIQVVPPFYNHPSFIEACSEVARPHLAEFKPDHIIMSFHGLPERHMIKSDEASVVNQGPAHCLQSDACCDKIIPANRNCYRAQSFATARAIAASLNLTDDDYEVTFQSRLGRSPWIKPYTDIRINELANQGKKRIAVLSPSFVADCLETLEEIAIRAQEDFQARGGEEIRLVPSLNAEHPWPAALIKITQDALADVTLPTT